LPFVQGLSSIEENNRKEKVDGRHLGIPTNRKKWDKGGKPLLRGPIALTRPTISKEIIHDN